MTLSKRARPYSLETWGFIPNRNIDTPQSNSPALASANTQRKVKKTPNSCSHKKRKKFLPSLVGNQQSAEATRKAQTLTSDWDPRLGTNKTCLCDICLEVRPKKK